MDNKNQIERVTNERERSRERMNSRERYGALREPAHRPLHQSDLENSNNSMQHKVINLSQLALKETKNDSDLFNPMQPMNSQSQHSPMPFLYPPNQQVNLSNMKHQHPPTSETPIFEELAHMEAKKPEMYSRENFAPRIAIGQSNAYSAYSTLATNNLDLQACLGSNIYRPEPKSLQATVNHHNY